MRNLNVLSVFICLFYLASCAQTTTDLPSPSSEGAMSFEVTVYGPDNASQEIQDLGINLTVYKAVFENGLTVLVAPNHSLPIFSMYTFFDVGGRYEQEGTTGASHFLEHMLFKGSKRYGPGEFDTLIEESGGRMNAYVNFDMTVYHQHLPTFMLERIIDMEADRMTDVLLHPVAFEAERQVIFNERKLRYENSPRGQLYLEMMQTFFQGTPYGGSVIGSVEDLTHLQRDDVLKFFHNFYTPDNAIVVFAGDVTAQDVFALVARYYAHLEPSSEELRDYKKERDDPRHYQRSTPYQKHVKIETVGPETLFALAYAGDSMTGEQGHLIDFVSAILGSGESSFLNQHYVAREDSQVSSIGAHQMQLKNDGIFFVMGSLKSDVDVEWFKNDLISQLKRSCDIAITDRSIQKVKNQLLSGVYSAMKTNRELAEFLGRSQFFYGDFREFESDLLLYNEVEKQQVREKCHQMFGQDKYIFISG